MVQLYNWSTPNKKAWVKGVEKVKKVETSVVLAFLWCETSVPAEVAVVGTAVPGRDTSLLAVDAPHATSVRTIFRPVPLHTAGEAPIPHWGPRVKNSATLRSRTLTS